MQEAGASAHGLPLAQLAASGPEPHTAECWRGPRLTPCALPPGSGVRGALLPGDHLWPEALCGEEAEQRSRARGRLSPWVMLLGPGVGSAAPPSLDRKRLASCHHLLREPNGLSLSCVPRCAGVCVVNAGKVC